MSACSRLAKARSEPTRLGRIRVVGRSRSRTGPRSWSVTHGSSVVVGCGPYWPRVGSTGARQKAIRLRHLRRARPRRTLLRLRDPRASPELLRAPRLRGRGARRVPRPVPDAARLHPCSPETTRRAAGRGPNRRRIPATTCSGVPNRPCRVRDSPHRARLRAQPRQPRATPTCTGTSLRCRPASRTTSSSSTR